MAYTGPSEHESQAEKHANTQKQIHTNIIIPTIAPIISNTFDDVLFFYHNHIQQL